MNVAQRQDGSTQPAGHSKIPLLHKPGSTQPRPLPNPQCLTQDSGQLFTYFVGETASSEKMTFAQNVDGQQESLPGTTLLSRGPNPCPAAGQATGALGVPGCLLPTRRVWRRGKGCYFKRRCGCLTNRCGRGFSFKGQLCSQPTAAQAPWTAPQG